MGTSTRPGDLLAGRYRLVDLLSESGGGRFWRAHDLVLERSVALHVIAEDDPRADSLLAAASASAQVLDPRILRVLDADERDGRCYVVNEWGTGTSLDILVGRGGMLGPRRAAWLATEVAGAIAKAHSVGIAHGRLNPENVLIDRYGAIRLIGLCVDAALHGVRERDLVGPDGTPACSDASLEKDRADLAGLLYCGLTGTWPGPSGSIVTPAPRDAGGHVLAPRRVRAGVPRPLDHLWREVAGPEFDRSRRHAYDAADLATAAGIAQQLVSFLGDTTGLPEALAASIPPFNEVRPVVLPSVDDPLPFDRDDKERGGEQRSPRPGPAEQSGASGASEARREPGEASAAEAGPTAQAEPQTEEPAHAVPPTQPANSDESLGQQPRIDGPTPSNQPELPPGVDLPTEAGMPVFGDDDSVEWLRARATPVPPPPPFEEPPAKPLFAPDPPDGQPVRRPRLDVPRPAPPQPDPTTGSTEFPTGFWPFADSDALGPPTGETLTGEKEPVPGRSWLRLAMSLGAALLLLMAIVVAFNLGRGRTPLGAEPEPAPSESHVATISPEAAQLTGLEAVDFDPFGDDEHPDEVSNAIDGDLDSVWPTDLYQDQIGPGLYKPGVGLLVDLGGSHAITDVQLVLNGTPTTVELFVYPQRPTEGPSDAGVEPVVVAEATRTSVQLTPAEPADGRWVLIWFTSLPAVDGGYRGGLAEVVIEGE